jgi:hypothetical protein
MLQDNKSLCRIKEVVEPTDRGTQKYFGFDKKAQEERGSIATTVEKAAKQPSKNYLTVENENVPGHFAIGYER